jgi:hypothetical protein
MSHLTTRSGKGASLTYGEMDGNWNELDRRTGDGWDDLVAPMEIQTGSPAAPTLTEWMEGMYFPEFNHTNDLAVLGKFHINHRYKLGTMLYPHFHFSPNDNAPSGVVVLGFRYKLARRHDSTGQVKFTNAVELRLEFTIPSNSAGTHFVAEVPTGFGIPATHIEPDVMVLMETFRRATDLADTFEGSIWGQTHDLHYECDVASTPNRAPDFYA